MVDKFFFYGTLMSGQGRDFRGIRQHAEPTTPALCRGDLYSVGGSFPAMVAGDGVVVGEVWRAHSPEQVADVLRITDAIEGYNERTDSGMYLRRQVTLLAPEIEVFTYIWNRPEDRWLERIPGGDWRAWRYERAWADEIDAEREPAA